MSGKILSVAQPGRIGILLYGSKGVFGASRLPPVLEPFEVLNAKRICALFATLGGFTVIMEVNGITYDFPPGCDMPTGGELEIKLPGDENTPGLIDGRR